MTDIFISYARADRAKIEKFVSALEAEGYSVWWDRHVAGGSEFSKDIEKELAAAKAVIVAWSKQSIESRWVKDEAGLAAEAGKLVSLSLDGSLPPIGFKQFHAIDFSSNTKTAHDDLKRSIALKIDAGQPAEAAPTMPAAALATHAGRPKISAKLVGVALSALAFMSVIAFVVMRDDTERVVPSGTGAEPEAAASSDVTSTVSGSAGIDLVPEQTLTPRPEKSIAVLPFANRSPDPDDAFFTEGMHDDLLTRLSKIADMHVISRTSVIGYAGTERKIPDIARELGVATIMEGAVQRAGSRVRINVQLIDADSDLHLWAETYDRELTAENIFDIQSEITKAIAVALNSVLSEADEAELEILPTQSLAAYDAYIRGKGLLEASFLTEDKFNDAIKEFDEAIAADPDFAAAYAAKAEAQLSIFWRIDAGNTALREKARANIDRAEALMPDEVETLVARGYFHYWGFLDYERADTVIDRALAKAPNNAEVWALKGYVARRAGRFDESATALRRANSLDPLSEEIPWQLVQSYIQFNRFEDAQAIVDHARALDPTSERVFTMDVRIMLESGEFERAWTLISETTPGSGWTSYYFFRLIIAIAARDSEKISYALESFPADPLVYPGNPEIFPLTKAEALAAMGLEEESRALLNEINERIKASDNPYPAGWSANATYLPVELPGLMGDLAGVRAAVADFEASITPDAFSDLNRHYAIAIAFERAGDRDSAFEYLDKITRLVGPSQYLSIKVDPDFDGIRDDPRYLVMKANYETWAAERNGR